MTPCKMQDVVALSRCSDSFTFLIRPAVPSWGEHCYFGFMDCHEVLLLG